MFLPSDYLKTAIQNRNYVQIRNELCGFIHKDPTFSKGSFNTALKFVQSQVPDVMEEHDQREPEPRDAWNKDYWALVVSDLMSNFSMARVKHVEDVGKVVFRVVSQSTTGTTRIGSSSGGTTHRPISGNSRSRGSSSKEKKFLIVTLITLGILLFLIAVMGFKKFLILLGVTLLIGGIVIIAINRKKKPKRRW